MPVVLYRPRLVVFPFLPWATGRFYDCSTQGGGNPSSTVTGITAVSAVLTWIPTITLTAIGCEVTTAGGAGSKQRIAIYTAHAVTFLPDRLIVDSGQLVADATGFQSATISVKVRGGWYYIAHANNTVTTNPIYRATNFTFKQRVEADAWPEDLAVDANYIQVSGRASNAVDVGFPVRFWPEGKQNSAFSYISGNVPRVLIGV